MFSTVFQLVKIKISGDISSMISFMRGRNSKDQSITVGTAIILGIIIIAFAFMMIFSFGMASVIGYQMYAKGCSWLFYPMAFLVSGTFALMGTVFAAQSYLYDAKDNDLLLSMPIKPSSVLLSRMMALYLLNFLYTNLLFIPCGVAHFILSRTVAFSILMKPSSIACFWISMFLIPLLVTALSSVFGYLVGRLSARITNKNVFTVMLGFFVIGFMGLLTLRFSDILNTLMNRINVVAYWIKPHMPLLYWYGIASMPVPEELFLDAVPLFALIIVFTAIVYVVLSFRFSKIITKKVSPKKKKYVRGQLKSTNIQSALIFKEVGYFLSIPSYVMNAGMSTIMAVLLGVGIIMRGNVINEWLPKMFPDASTNLLALAIGSSLSLSCTMNDVTAPTISLEGRTIWILKSTPIKPMRVFFAKALLAPIVSLPGVCFTAVASALVLNLNTLDILFVFASPLLACVFSGFLGVCVNLKMPRFDWTNEITVIKQSLSVIFTLLLSMFFTAVPFVVAIVPSAYLEDFSSLSAYGICTIYFILLIVLEIFFLSTDGKKIWNEL
ncbi:MAG: hypothetical protein IIY78_10525 [Clostridia bacterium]|nr:hypothetical protein [Clostridia bacterium]